jgi:hypothetical protein
MSEEIRRVQDFQSKPPVLCVSRPDCRAKRKAEEVLSPDPQLKIEHHLVFLVPFSADASNFSSRMNLRREIRLRVVFPVEVPNELTIR